MDRIFVKAINDMDFREKLMLNPEAVGKEYDLSNEEIENLKAIGLDRIKEELVQIDEDLLGTACAWCNNSIIPE